MTTGSPPTTFVARLTADEPSAKRIAALLAECFDPGDAACAAFAEPDGRWQVAVHFRDKPDEAALREIIALAGDPAVADGLTIDTVEARDWVKSSLEGLKPVAAGRFVVHGAHDRGGLPPSRIGIEIEAALAFGTGHHGTTRGCLIALDAIARQSQPRRILDVGTGTGVLAIAAAKRFGRHVLASDIDRASVQIARENARINGVGPLVECVHAAGLNAPELTARAPYDLVFANILLPPLLRLAAPLARQLAPNARVILSGLLRVQASAAVAAYRAQGLVLERMILLDGWATLVMIARSSRSRLINR